VFLARCLLPIDRALKRRRHFPAPLAGQIYGPRDELRATGVASATTRPDTRDGRIDRAGRQIATLAATGRTNKQIG
jgi:hypothetical protein